MFEKYKITRSECFFLRHFLNKSRGVRVDLSTIILLHIIYCLFPDVLYAVVNNNLLLERYFSKCFYNLFVTVRKYLTVRKITDRDFHPTYKW